MENTNHFKVIIVGGGIAGLTLANCLQHANIDYVLLEARDEFAPQVGASIAVMPNGARILDQLDMFDELEAGLETVNFAADRYVSGELMHPAFDGPQLAITRSGYGAAFGDRQHVLKVLYDHIQDKNKVFLRKRLDRIEDTTKGVKVYCTDGSVYEGDVVAGADGVNSRVRDEMWRLADEAHPGLISAEERQCMTAEYKCMYGICDPVPGVSLRGDVNVNYTKYASAMVIGSKTDGFYVFLNEKLDRVYRRPEIPRFTDQDAFDFGEKYSDLMVLPDMSFGTLWKGRRSQKLVSLEEADFKTWTYGRIACLGDSIHKMTPDAGQGGNSSLESAAALSNALKRMLDGSTTKPTKLEVEASLKQFQQDREKRMRPILKACNELTRLHTMSTPSNKFFLEHIAHRLGDALMDFQAEMMVGATKLDFLPAPKRSLECHMPFNPYQGEGFKESKLKRASLALPFIGLCLFATYYTMDVSPSVPYAIEKLLTGKVEWAMGSVDILDSFYHMNWLDDIWRPIVLYFTSSIYGYDVETRAQCLSFLFDIGPFLAIIYIESTRRSNALTFAYFPILIGLAAQFRGIGAVVPVYYWLHYIHSPVSVFKATDGRLTNLSYTSAVLPSLLLSYYLPTLAQFFHPSLPARQAWNWIWQMWPVWISVATWAGSHLRTDTMNKDRLCIPRRDLLTIRATVGVTVAISAMAWWYTLFSFPVSMVQLFIPRRVMGDPADIDDYINVFLKWDELLLFTNSFLWLAYLFWDLKVAGMVKTSWSRLLVSGALALVTLGPGAALGLGWLWREQGITFGRHWGAVISAEPEVAPAGVAGEKNRRDSGIDEKIAVQQ